MGAIKAVDQFLQRTRNIPYSPYLFVFVPILVTGIRLTEETVLGHNLSNVHLIFNYFAGYLQLQIMLTAALTISTGRDWRQVVGPASLGLVLGFLPPILDLLLPAAGEQTTYRYFEEFRWHFYAPYQLLGETIIVWMGVLFIGIYSWWDTGKSWRALIGLIGGWVSLQVFAYAWIATGLALFGHMGEAGLDAITMLALATVFMIYLTLNAKTMLPSLMRFNHALPWGFLAAIGSHMAGQSWMIAIGKGLTMAFAFQLLTFANDFFDRDADAAVGGSARPVTADDHVFILFYHLLLAFWAALIFPSGFFLLALFLALGTAYHLPQLRFKRLFCMGYKIEGMAAASAFLFGAMGFERFPDGRWAAVIALLVFGGFSLGSMFKDYKDIDQDRVDKVGTIYTRYMKKGVSLSAIHRFVYLAMALMFCVPPLWLLSQGGSMVSILLLFVLAIATGVSLAIPKDRKRAVELTLWMVTIYLAAWLWVAPVMA